MKRLLMALIAVLMVSSFAHATPMKLVDVTTFGPTATNASEDLISYGGRYVNKLEYFSDYVKWQHQFSFVPAAKEILHASLTLSLRDDGGWWDGYEFGFGITEGGQWDIGEVDTGKVKYGVDVALLEDGVFQVVLASVGGDFYIDKSKLAIKYAPVPEPSTLLLLGGGLLGLGYFGRKRMKKS